MSGNGSRSRDEEKHHRVEDGVVSRMRADEVQRSQDGVEDRTGDPPVSLRSPFGGFGIQVVHSGPGTWEDRSEDSKIQRDTSLLAR